MELKLIGNQTLVDLVTDDRKKLAIVRRYAREYRWPERSAIKEKFGADYELVVKLAYLRGEFSDYYGLRCECGGKKIALNPGIIYTRPDGTQGKRIFGFHLSPRMLATLCFDCNNLHNIEQMENERMYPDAY